MNVDAYSYFAYQIQIMLPFLSTIKALGIDGELAVIITFENASLMLFACAALRTSKTIGIPNFVPGTWMMLLGKKFLQTFLELKS